MIRDDQIMAGKCGPKTIDKRIEAGSRFAGAAGDQPDVTPAGAPRRELADKQIDMGTG